MRSFLAFFKKELLETRRSGKLTLLGLLFFLFGVMNPAVAKLTPWLMEIMSDSLAESGMVIGEVTVDALTSWTQFFKNIPMALIVFVLVYGGCFTKEYEHNTLIPILTKGLPRRQVVLAKSLTLLLVWSLGYWLCFGVTYGYTAYFWDQTIVENLFFSALSWWAFGVWTVGLIVLFSTLAASSGNVLLGTGSVALASYLIGLIAKVKKFVPTKLMDGNSLTYGMEAAEDYLPALIIALTMAVICIGISIPIFNKKQL